MGSYAFDSRITSTINIDGKVFAKNMKDEFGQVEIDGSGKFSFIPLSKLNYEFEYCPHNFLHSF